MLPMQPVEAEEPRATIGGEVKEVRAEAEEEEEAEGRPVATVKTEGAAGAAADEAGDAVNPDPVMKTGADDERSRRQRFVDCRSPTAPGLF